MDPASYSLLLTTKFMFASSGMAMTVSVNSVKLKYSPHKIKHSIWEETTAG